MALPAVTSYARCFWAALCCPMHDARFVPCPEVYNLLCKFAGFIFKSLTACAALLELSGQMLSMGIATHTAELVCCNADAETQWHEPHLQTPPHQAQRPASTTEASCQPVQPAAACRGEARAQC